MTLILLAGQVFPTVLRFDELAAIPHPWPWWGLSLTALAVTASYYPRLGAVWRFRQSLLGALLHLLGILVLLSIQWYAFLRNLSGRPVTWKGTPYRPAKASDSTQWEHLTR